MHGYVSGCHPRMEPTVNNGRSPEHGAPGGVDRRSCAWGRAAMYRALLWPREFSQIAVLIHGTGADFVFSTGNNFRGIQSSRDCLSANSCSLPQSTHRYRLERAGPFLDVTFGGS